MTFEDFLRKCIKKGTDARIKAHERGDAPNGYVRFYAHTLGVDGSTVDFDVRGNELTPLVTDQSSTD